MKFVLAWLLVAVPAWACTCGSQGLEEAYKSSAAVFSGKIVGISADGLWNVVKLKAEKVYKGPLKAKSEHVLRTANFAASCGYEFTPGETYLIWASDRTGQLSTSICTRTRLLKEAERDLRWLDSQ